MHFRLGGHPGDEPDVANLGVEREVDDIDRTRRLKHLVRRPRDGARAG